MGFYQSGPREASKKRGLEVVELSVNMVPRFRSFALRYIERARMLLSWIIAHVIFGDGTSSGDFVPRCTETRSPQSSTNVDGVRTLLCTA